MNAGKTQQRIEPLLDVEWKRDRKLFSGSLRSKSAYTICIVRISLHILHFCITK